MSDSPPAALAIAIGQLNPVMGDIAGNLEKARLAHGRGDGAQAPTFWC